MASASDPVPTPINTARSQLDNAFAAEEESGMRIATHGRAAALGIIVVLAVSFVGYPPALYIQALLLVLIALGYLHFAIVRRRGRSVWRYALIFADFALLSLVLFLPNPLVTAPVPDQMLLRHGLFTYYIFIAVAVSFTYVPKLMLFAGFAAAATWSVGVVELLHRPETVTDMSRMLDPHFVDVDLWIQEVVLMLLITAMLGAVVARFRRLVAREAAASRQRANLARYFAPTMVDRLAGQDEMLGRSRVQPVAVLFADIVGFTALAETMAPEEVIGLLRRFDAAMEEAVFDHSGTLDKYLGDGIMATFGTPETGPRDAINALACAAAMHEAMADLNRARRADGLPPINLSVGIHHGDVVLGDVGSARRLEFAVLGDVVNVASKLEAITRPHDAATAITARLAEACLAEDARDAERLLAPFGPPLQVDLSGKARPFPARLVKRPAMETAGMEDHA